MNISGKTLDHNSCNDAGESTRREQILANIQRHVCVNRTKRNDEDDDDDGDDNDDDDDDNQGEFF